MGRKTHPEPSEWAKATIDDIQTSRARLNQASADFLKVDVQTALTFCQIAHETQDPKKKLRNRHHARRGYDTIRRLREKVTLTAEQSQDLEDNLERLRDQLLQLGEAV